MEFGTGAVKITPAHDHNDYDCGKRHNLPFVEMMDDDGNVTDVCPQFKVNRQTHRHSTTEHMYIRMTRFLTDAPFLFFSGYEEISCKDCCS